jgi:hypothetical protein
MYIDNMHFKEFIFETADEDFSSKIKNFFLNNGECCVIRNYNNFSNDEIKRFYEKLNLNIGNMAPIDLEKDTYSPTGKFWSDVKYDYNSDEKQFWRSSNHQNLHTDNSFSYDKYYATLTQLVCLKPVEYSGNTAVISNETIVELLHFLRNKTDSTLFDRLLNKNINFSCNSTLQIKKPILLFNSEKNKYVFNFNYFPAKRAINTEENYKLIEEFNNFLEEKIMHSNLMNEYKLNRGDAIIFNDELVMHGRRSFIGTRHYIKCGINIAELNLISNDDYKCETI